MEVNYELKEIQEAVLAGKTTVRKLVEDYLHKIEQHNERLNIYTIIFADEALALAEQQDQAIAKAKGEQLGDLFACVVSVKDVIAIKGKPLTAASKILSGYKSLFDATAVQRLIEAGAIIIGMTNCDEFGMGSANENSYYGATKNGIDAKSVPGGSSGAAAVSVQMDTCLVALGSDTGGSVRQPASFCGIYGFKPSYGKISRYGLVAYASSFDTIGILSKSITSIQSVLAKIAGPDELDATCAAKLGSDPEPDTQMKPLNIAVFPELLDHPSLDPEINISIKNHIQQLVSAGHSITTHSFKYTEELVPTYYILTTAEASTNLSRYDGVRYGHRSQQAETLEELYVNSRTEGFGTEVKKRILLGTYVLSEGYFEAYYTKAQKVRRLIKEQLESVFEEADLILLPTSTSTAWESGIKDRDAISVYMSDIFTVLANLAGLPALAVPIGNDKEGKPIGVQYMHKHLKDERLLEFTSQLASKINTLV